MPVIPNVMDLGQRPVPQRASGIVSDDSGAIVPEALGQFAGTIANVADHFDQKTQELARAKDANNYLDHQIAVKQLEQTYKDRISTGELAYGEAQQKFTEDAAKIQAPQPQARGQIAAENLNRGISRNIAGAEFSIGQAVDVAKQKDLQSQGALQLDSLGKLAGMPDANIDSINKQADLVAPLLRTAGLNPAQVSRAIQDFKDKNWLNQATQRAMQAKDSLVAIKAMEHDLTAADGFYAGKLDTDKRNAVLRQVINDRMQIEYRAQHEADKRDALAERTLYKVDQQIASGVPATAAMWSTWEGIVKGTPAEAEFKDRLDDEKQVQEVLRQPVGDQVNFVQDKEAALLSAGGSLRDRANFIRLKTAVQANVTQLQSNPLLFNANRNGQDIAPLDFSTLDSPETATQVQDRLATLRAMQKQYGAAVPIKPLLPQEAQQLTSALSSATPKEQASLFGDLNTAMGDSQAFRAAMQQIAPDAPVKALAGMLTAKQAELTTGTHWFRPDDTIASQDVAATMLQGEQLLHPSKEHGKEDGKPKAGLFLPETKTLQNEFQGKVGAAFAGRPNAAEIAFQAVQAYYVGKAAQTGRLASGNADIDTDLVEESIKATLGGVADYNGEGEVLMPWGMTQETFDDRAQQAIDTEIRQRKLTGNAANALLDAGLRNAGDGTYYLMQGRNFSLDQNGHPIVIDINQAPEPFKTPDVVAPVVKPVPGLR